MKKTLEWLKISGEAPSWLTNSGFQTLTNGYLQNGETPKEMWMRVSIASASRLGKPELAEQFFELFFKGWLCGSTPVLANMGTERGLPISCFANHIPDTTTGIWQGAHEIAMLSKYGGGCASYWGDVRSKGSPISSGGTTEGIVPFLKVYDSTIIGVSQGSTRRGSMAIYLPWDHGDALDFLRIRRPDGDVNRQCLNVHHAICLDDNFFDLLAAGDEKARHFAIELYKTRLETGEPYVFFSDNVKRNRPKAYVDLGLEVKTSNLCSEITLFTDPEHTFVCCLSSMNLAKWDEWKDTNAVYLATWFLEGIMSEFIDKAKGRPGLEAAVRHAEKGRALGLGALGFHSLLQSKMLAFGDFGTTILNKAIFKTMRDQATKASQDMAKEYGKPEWCATIDQRHTHLLALAPTASNAIISGDVSPSIEPLNANAFAKKSAKGTFISFNPALKELLASKGQDTDEVWSKIVADAGSVRSLDFLSSEEKSVFRTAFEIDMRDLIDLAADRQKYIDQAQSLNLFFNADVDPQYFHEVHLRAWKKGLNTLYYCRSSSVLKADISSRDGSECKACEG
jgi:ribonucleoside-diphosphate reductase alpha chain